MESWEAKFPEKCVPTSEPPKTKTMRFCNHLNISQEKLGETWWNDHGIDILQPTAEEDLTVFRSAAAATAAMPRKATAQCMSKGDDRGPRINQVIIRILIVHDCPLFIMVNHY